VDQDENRTATDRVIHGLSNLRGRMNDLLVDQTEIKQNVRSVRSLVRDVRNDTRVYAEVRPTYVPFFFLCKQSATVLVLS